MRQLAIYSFVNAKIRAMLSYLIEPSFFDSLLASRDIYEAAEGLKKTPYKEIIGQLDLERLDLKVLEKECLRRDVAIFEKVSESLSAKREKQLVGLFLERYEIEELKVALRIWHKKADADIDDYIIRRQISRDIDFKKIVGSGTIEEIIILLDDTPYKKPLLAARERFKERSSVFYLEVALDVDYYTRLFALVDTLSSTDRKIARGILGVAVDIENINWLIRLRKYYALGMGQMLDWVLPGGTWITKETVRHLYASDGLPKVVESVALGPYAAIREMVEENVGSIEKFLYEFLFREIKRALSGFPFTIGTVLGYLLLKQNETKNVISLLNAKNLGLSKQEIEQLITL